MSSLNDKVPLIGEKNIYDMQVGKNKIRFCLEKTLQVLSSTVKSINVFHAFFKFFPCVAALKRAEKKEISEFSRIIQDRALRAPYCSTPSSAPTHTPSFLTASPVQVYKYKFDDC